MKESRHTILCVDDEPNILNSLKRLLRKEEYRLLSASSGSEGLEILGKNNVHLVISDQRMPEMSGTDFLTRVMEAYPDIIRIILTGYTEVDAITESINRGHIYKFFLKPWNDENLKLEIKNALDQYDLIETNKRLNKKILEQNEELRKMNEGLEEKINERTRELELRNQALELYRAVLEDIPAPVIGVSAEKTIVLVNQRTEALSVENGPILIGEGLSEYFPEEIEKCVSSVFQNGHQRLIRQIYISGKTYTIDISPLSGRFRGKGVVMTLLPAGRPGTEKG